MENFVGPEIEQYAVDHTTPLPDYLEELVKVTHQKMAGPQMLSGPVEGMLLQFLVRALGARRVLEIGTFTGFSALMAMADGMWFSPTPYLSAYGVLDLGVAAMIGLQFQPCLTTERWSRVRSTRQRLTWRETISKRARTATRSISEWALHCRR